VVPSLNAEPKAVAAETEVVLAAVVVQLAGGEVFDMPIQTE